MISKVVWKGMKVKYPTWLKLNELSHTILNKENKKLSADDIINRALDKLEEDIKEPEKDPDHKAGAD